MNDDWVSMSGPRACTTWPGGRRSTAFLSILRDQPTEKRPFCSSEPSADAPTEAPLRMRR
eukprot:5821029-Prymnesium_polylepis.1